MTISKYAETMEYWDNTFEAESLELDVSEPFTYPEIESGLEWVCGGSRRILDFGCGNGHVLLHCLSLGVEYGIGIDISPAAISLANRISSSNALSDRVEFIGGSTSQLKVLDDGSVDAVILFNVIDNMVPPDAHALIEELKRVTCPGGKILLKLNDHVPDATLVESNGYEKICDGFYREESGLYLWNLSCSDLESMLAPDLAIEQSMRVEFRQYKIWNRLYLIRKRA